MSEPLAVSAIGAVTFDFWNTLVAENPLSPARRKAKMVEELVAHGYQRSDADLEEAVRQIRAWFEEQWLANAVVNPERGAVRFAQALGVEHNPDVTAAFESVFRAGSDPSGVQPAPGIGDALAGLRERGVRIGIICDAGLAPGATLRGYLAHHDLLDFFDGWSFSDEVGVFKPDQRIFQNAVSALGLDPQTQVAHVGDLRRTDIAGALEMGWTAVRYRGLNDDSPMPDDPDEAIPDGRSAIIDHHDELLGVLGLTSV